MAQLQKNRSYSLASIVPRSKKGRLVAGSVALLTIIVCAYYAGATTYEMETTAKRFVDRYQDIDQRPYRNL